jgi:hypothetical protein
MSVAERKENWKDIRSKRQVCLFLAWNLCSDTKLVVAYFHPTEIRNRDFGRISLLVLVILRDGSQNQRIVQNVKII